jgi:hypothetical protein
MPANKKLLVLPGDGIGPEVMRETRRIIDWMERRRMVSFEISEGLVGGAAIDATGSPCPAARNGTACPSTSGPNSASCGCGRISACSRIFARRWCSTRWRMPPPFALISCAASTS